jgi:uncharacterized protein
LAPAAVADTKILGINLLSGGSAMAHYFEIKQNKAGEYVAYFKYNSESIFWTEGYKSKASAQNAIDSILKNGPGAEVREG